MMMSDVQLLPGFTDGYFIQCQYMLLFTFKRANYIPTRVRFYDQIKIKCRVMTGTLSHYNGTEALVVLNQCRCPVQNRL